VSSLTADVRAKAGPMVARRCLLPDGVTAERRLQRSAVPRERRLEASDCLPGVFGGKVPRPAEVIPLLGFF
jgi:hypothetical protein